jgi:hypothetical protein
MKKYFNKYYNTFFLLFSNFVLFAQVGNENDTNDLENADTLAAPINDYLWVLALVGLVFVFIKLKSYSRQFDNLTVFEKQKLVNNNLK